ncbi:hypothetical protein SeLEV6574_g01777 [Synchytrium endobioticum]|nr:hypothetical protein SeLEV6574_g01777 [Synchytrium endobioticum]
MSDLEQRRHAWSIYILSFLIKWLLIPAYRSTDFEVHRNWLAITHSLPISKWYHEASSEWTLDYPPLFAWLEKLLSVPAQLFDCEMLKLCNLNYASPETVLYQRLTVIISESVLFLASWRYAKNCPKEHVITQLALVFLNPGLIMVDNIHFQYNGFLYGILVLSINSIFDGNVLFGAATFAALLNLKHIFIYTAPAFFVYLLRSYCFHKNGSFYVSRLVALGLSVIAVLAISFGPLYNQIPQVLSRLFPFKRGLCHAYWAPNFWALYAFADRVLIQIARILRLPIREVPTLTRGLVGDVNFVILPNIHPIHTFVLTALAQLPCLIRVWKAPSKHNFIICITLCGFASFMFGWHVHEKAILMVLVPLSLIATKSPEHARLFYVLSLAGIFSLFPLLFGPTETVIKVCLLLLFGLIAHSALSKSTPSFALHNIDRMYIHGMVLTHLYVEYTHHLLFPDGKLEFLPLMIVSVYSSVGIMYVYINIITKTMML